MKMKAHTLQGHYAGFLTRLLAFMIDTLIIIIVLGVVSYSLSFIWRFFDLLPNVFTDLFGSTDAIINRYKAALPTIMPIVNTVIIFGYFIFFWMSSGQTLGKAFMGVRVVSVSGRPLTFLQAFLRLLLYPVSALVFFLGFIWILVDNQRQGWHDTLARTYVIYTWRAVPHATFLHQWQHKWRKPVE